MELRHKICIIGAGPAGLVLANILNNEGIDCIVLDRRGRDEITKCHRAGLIDHRSVLALKKHNLAQGLLQYGQPHTICEFRMGQGDFLLEYTRLSGGAMHYIYPQQELIKDLIQSFEQAHGTIRFNTEATFVINENGAQVEYYDKKQKKSQRVNCDFVAGCDGFHGISRRSVPSSHVRIVERYYDSSWLAILAEAPPSANHIIYALHPNGFAGHMLRSDKVSRYYLQVKNTDDVNNWPDERVWTELELRLGKEGWRLIQGEILEKQIIPMRNFVIEPMQYQRLFLAGDSAHIITPAGGKGMNLAIQDSLVLGELFVGHYRGDFSADLNAYSSIRLPDIWHAQEFSSSFLDILSRSNDAFETDLFTRKLNESRLLQLRDNPLVATDFSKKYAGAMADPHHYAYGN